MMKFYIDEEGNYLGGFDGADPPEGAIEVISAPDNASQIWNEDKWGLLEKTWDEIRILRCEKFNNIDWRIQRYRTQLLAGIDTTESDETYNALLNYMQELRDIPESFSTANDVIWPDVP